ncbi:MAG: hypothetical protein IID33_07905, partial [Planctomycetes bacterium]|nr:hypothetical protein [Planctomycetota bacterium]
VNAFTNTAQESELIIRHWFRINPPLNPLFEYNVAAAPDPPIPSAIPSVLRVYPPISANVPITLANYAPYVRRRISDDFGFNNDQESVKALDRQVVWTAFHRRVSYAPGSDPSLYEVIVVVAKRPTDQHRFARQKSIVGESFVNPDPVASYPNGRSSPGADRLAPMAWLVYFTGVPFPDLLGIYTHNGLTNPERMLDTGAAEPPSLQFTCSIKVGEKLPPGSIIIPALNDANNSDPTQPGGPGISGFVPHAPDSLPIYEVTDRIRDDSAPAGQEYKIIVKNNGTYPWVDPVASPRVSFWPAWIIPPAIKTDSGTNQVFENKSPIIAVARRYMRFPEVP